MSYWLRIAAYAAHGFVLLAACLLLAPSALDQVDLLFTNLIAPLQTESGINLFLVVTALGGGIGIILASVAFAYFARLSSVNVLRLALLLVGVLFANKILKEFFARARPETLQWFDALPSYSFPSAHATSAMALYGFIAIVLYRRYRSLWAVVIPSLVIVLVGASRIVLAAHYFTDVVAGFLLGLVLLAVTFALPVPRLLKKYA